MLLEFNIVRFIIGFKTIILRNDLVFGYAGQALLKVKNSTMPKKNRDCFNLRQNYVLCYQ
jgi:hypothetical protein